MQTPFSFLPVSITNSGLIYRIALLNCHLNMTSKIIDKYIAQEDLSPEFRNNCKDHFLPLAEQLAPLIQEKSKGPFIVGINGSQGSGKSTLGKFLTTLFNSLYDLNSIVVSIDDFYLEKKKRLELGKNIHPLFETRGPPGTHDLELATKFFRNVRGLAGEKGFKVPSFEKAHDDRAPEDLWPVVKDPLDVLIFEGWCIGAKPEMDITEAVNELERLEDPKRDWRRHANSQLSQYQKLWEEIDYLIFLKAPSIETIIEWRKLQERKLKKNSSGKYIMSDQEIERFFSFYQRLTLHCLNTIPDIADIIFELDDDHAIVKSISRTT